MRNLAPLPSAASRDAARGTRRLAVFVLLATAVAFTSAFLLAPNSAQAEPERSGYGESTALEVVPPEWPPAIQDRFASLAIQDGGRVKPLNTYATYALMRMCHKRRVKTPDGRTLKPLAWFVDVLLHPDAARKYDMFLIETDEIAQAIGISSEGKKKRDLYSYDRVIEGRQRLFQLAREYSNIDEKERDKIQTGTLGLAHALSEFEGILYFLDFARNPVRVDDLPALSAILGDETAVSVSTVLAKVPQVVSKAREAMGTSGDASSPVVQQTEKLFQRTLRSSGRSMALDIFPPPRTQADRIRAARERKQDLDLDPEAWLSPLTVVEHALNRPHLPIAESHVAMLADFEAMVDAREDLAAVGRASADLSTRSRALAEDLDLYEKIPLEVRLFRLAPFGGMTIGFFIIAFILVALSWMWPNKWLVRGAWTLLIGLAILLVVGITMRCILRERPPISTLYETVIFITATGVIAALVIEAMTRQRIALALAPVLGIVGLYMAGGYENITRQDTMPKLVAVLDTNFWLWSHVTCISLGYMGALFQGLVAHVFVLGKVFGIKKNDPEFYRTLTRMIYGLLGFGVIFATVGTILGGIWANDSWGRFWGWDPKENGALMIVLWQLVLIHARIGGIIKPWGLAIGSIILGGIVAFSWWGVNLLGIGLHTYGFASGVWNALMTFYAIELGVLLLATAWYLIQRSRVSAARI